MAQRRGRILLARLLLIAPFAALLWVPSYNRVEPAIAGIPFFYWYQLAWIPLGAVLLLTIYLSENRARRNSE